MGPSDAGGSDAVARSGDLGTPPASSLPLHMQTNASISRADSYQSSKDGSSGECKSKSHSEAEKRRRERINAHLGTLRNLLPHNTKADKASLLGEVIEHVKELQRQADEVAEEGSPTGGDELLVTLETQEDGAQVVKANMSCEDRPELLAEVVKAVQSCRLHTLRAEITTLGGRVRIEALLGHEEQGSLDKLPKDACTAVKEGLAAVMDRSAQPLGTVWPESKRQKMANAQTPSAS